MCLAAFGPSAPRSISVFPTASSPDSHDHDSRCKTYRRLIPAPQQPQHRDGPVDPARWVHWARMVPRAGLLMALRGDAAQRQLSHRPFRVTHYPVDVAAAALGAEWRRPRFVRTGLVGWAVPTNNRQPDESHVVGTAHPTARTTFQTYSGDTTRSSRLAPSGAWYRAASRRRAGIDRTLRRG